MIKYLENVDINSSEEEIFEAILRKNLLENIRKNDPFFEFIDIVSWRNKTKDDIYVQFIKLNNEKNEIIYKLEREKVRKNQEIDNLKK